MTDRRLTLKGVTEDLIKEKSFNLDPKDEVARMRSIKQSQLTAPGTLAIREYLQSLKER